MASNLSLRLKSVCDFFASLDTSKLFFSIHISVSDFTWRPSGQLKSITLGVSLYNKTLQSMIKNIYIFPLKLLSVMSVDNPIKHNE